MTRPFRNIFDVYRVGNPEAGSHIANALKEAQRMELDFIVFNERWVPVPHKDDGPEVIAEVVHDYLNRYPTFPLRHFIEHRRRRDTT